MGDILFLDIETTGTDPARDLILEIGFILVDEHLRETFRDSMVIHHDPEDVYARMNGYVREMHTKNGLLSEVESSVFTPEHAYQWLFARIPPSKPRVAGFSIHFDREFILTRWPSLRGLLHHRVVDVSTFREEAKVSAPRLVAPENPEGVGHRTLLDCERALYEHRWYREHVFERASHPMFHHEDFTPPR